MDYSTADLCSCCASIPWTSLGQAALPKEWNNEEQTYGDLQSSSCRLCRLIGSAIRAKVEQHAHLRSRLWILTNPTPKGYRKNCIGSAALMTKRKDSSGKLDFVGELILTTEESIREDVTAWSIVAPKRVDFAKVRPWLEACTFSHKFCKPVISPQLLNLRVIDCTRKAVVVAPIGCSFVALSYVWGDLSADSYVLGSQIVFPPTIEDAVRSTQELGYQYLWVDRYCINQGDPRDKEEQISQMGRIYASAQVTFVAAAGVDPSYGLVGISRDQNTLSAREPVGGSQYLRLYPEATQDHIVRSNWFSRAWTLQEGYLSNRVLCFTECEAVFSCKSGSWTATPSRHACWTHISVQEGVNKSIVRSALSSQIASLHDASKIIETYSKRVLGHDSDTLNAIIGILNVLKTGNPPIYHIWGVPFIVDSRLGLAHNSDSTVSISLNWSHSNGSRRLSEFPSWSTIGWRGNVYHLREAETTSHFVIKYWAGDKYQELDSGTCNLDYTNCQDATHQLRYLEITTYVVQVELQNRYLSNKVRHFIKPTFIRRKKGKDQEYSWDWPDKDTEGPFFELSLDDEISFDTTIPVLCATMTPFDDPSDSWRSFLSRDTSFLFFQKKAKSYERIGACTTQAYAINEREGKMYGRPESWEPVPPGEPGAWDQVAEKRTFLLG